MKKGRVLWLDGVDVSVMAWCKTLCHCQCQPQSSVSQSHCVCCRFNQCVGAAALSHFPLCPIPVSLMMRFGDAIEEQPSHSCSIMHNIVCQNRL